MVTTGPPYAGLPRRPRERSRTLRRYGGSAFAAGVQVGLALVIALGSIGLASVAALIAPGGGSPEQVVAATASRQVIAPRDAVRVPGAGDRADSAGAASPRPIPHR